MSSESMQPAEPSFEIDEIPGVVARLRASFDRGHTRSLAARRGQLLQIRQMLVDHGDALVEALAARAAD